MRILIIGFGSIGKRHYEVLKDKYIIEIVTRQAISELKTYKYLKDVDLNKYDYFIIASETYKHYEQLKYIDKNVKNKIIFCEKPLFEEYKNLEIKNNKVFTGYVLRYHPLLQKLKSKLKNQQILNIDVKCGQYLPTWRKEDYRNSYSAFKNQGGGVLLDLSHEIDYTQWLIGDIKELFSYQVKISDLKIDSDDFVTFIGKSEASIINLSIDYISKITYRKILLNTVNYTYELDFIKNKLIQKDKSGLEEIMEIKNMDRNYMFKKMHDDILGKQEYCCTYDDGLKVMKTILKIQKENK